MKIEYLREFVLLAKHLNFSATSSKLYITQSVLSRHISALEEEIGAQLFYRSTQTVTLTEAGSFFLRGVTSLLSEYDELVKETCLREQLYDKTLRIGINYYAFNYQIGAIPQHFKAHYPRTKISYQTGSPDELIRALLSDAVDAILVNHFPFPRANQLEFMDLFFEPYCVLLPDYHPLARHESVSIRDLGHESFLGVNTDVFSCSWKYLHSLFVKEGFAPQNPIFFDTLEETSVAVRHGIGVFIEGQILRLLTNSYLVCLPLIGEGCRRTVSVAYKKGNVNPAIGQLLDSYRHQLDNGWIPSI